MNTQAPNANALIAKFISEGMTHPQALAEAMKIVRAWALQNGLVK